jgi:hypothetical protein
MARRCEVVVTYRPNGDGELFQASVSLAAAYPDALDEARMQAVKAVAELIREALAQYDARDASD